MSITVNGALGARILPALVLLLQLFLSGCATQTGQAPSPAARDEKAPPAPSADESSLPSPDGFVLGEGDLIRLTMFGQPDMETSTYVSSDGYVSLPIIGNLEVGGLTPSAAAQRATKAYRDGGYFVDPQVSITVEQYRSRQISVLGEVNEPGRYPLETKTGLLDALAMAGGAMPTGSTVVTVIRRGADGGTERIRVDLDELVATGNNGMSMAAGDVLYVPEASKFYIYGEVREPNAYPIRPGMTVMQAISVGGGVTERGSASRVEIRRRQADGRVRVFEPELTDTVRADDVIYVKERFF